MALATFEAMTSFPMTDEDGASTSMLPSTESFERVTSLWPNTTDDGGYATVIDAEEISYYDNYEIVLFDKPVWHLTLIGIIYGVLVIVTVVGNIFVMVAYHRDIRIRRNIANAFILNLAIGDFIVGAFIWPVYLAWNLLGVWTFGEYLCKVWSFVDYTVTAVSVLTIILISLDRYYMLSKTTGYANYQTKRRVNVTIATCWIVVVAIYIVVIFGWSAFMGSVPIDYRYDCDAEFIYTFPSLITAVVVNFIIPAVVIATINVTVYYKIRARARGLDHLQSKIQRASNDKMQFNNNTVKSRLKLFRRKKESALPNAANEGKGINTGVILLSINGTKPAESHINPGFDPKAEISHSSSSEGTSGIGSGQEAQSGSDQWMNKDDYDDVFDEGKEGSANSPKGEAHSRDNVANSSEESANPRGKRKTTSVFTISSSSAEMASQQDKQKSTSPAKSKTAHLDKLRKKLKQKQREFGRERKAAFILAVLVSVFVLCWLPFNLTVIIGVICNYECIPENVFIATENLVWANSALNPILYAATNVHYRRNFLRFLGCTRLARKMDRPATKA